MTQTRLFFASVEHLHEMLEFILGEAKQVGFKPAALGQIELASEEAIVNVIHHAYKDRGGEIEIAVLSEPQKKCVITLSDDGEPFDPLVQVDPVDISASLEDRDIGGLGIHFIRKCLDEVSYSREGNWNVLTLVKKIHS